MSVSIQGSHILLMGSPGSGKGSFSEFLTKHGSFFHLSLGDLLRQEVQNQTPNGLECKKIMEAGQNVPFEIGWKIFEQHFNKAEKEGKCVIVDGMVQSDRYVQAFDLFFTGKKVAFVYLKAQAKLCQDRILLRLICKTCARVYSKSEAITNCENKCGPLVERPDDAKSEVVAARIDRFFNIAVKFVDHYRSRPTFIEIDTERDLNVLQETYRQLFIF